MQLEAMMDGRFLILLSVGIVKSVAGIMLPP